MCVGEQLYPPGVVRLERVTVGQEPKDRAAATVRYLSHREAWAYAANLADDVHAHRQPGSFNPKLQVLVSFLAFFWPARPVANGERVTVRVHPPLPLPSLLSRQGLFQSSGKPDDASRAAAIACATRAMRCQGFVGLDEQQCVQMRAMQLLFPGARLRPRFARAAYAAVRDAWLGDLREVGRDPEKSLAI